MRRLVGLVTRQPTIGFCWDCPEQGSRKDGAGLHPALELRPRPLGGMADAEDLKSSTSNGVPVRIREGLLRG